MSTEAQMDVERYGFNPGDMPDCFIPDNFHEVFQRIGIHGTKPRWNKRTGELETPHHVEGGVTAEDYIQIAAAVITAPDAIVAHDQDGGETRFYTKEIDGQSWVAVIPEHIIPGRRDPTMFPLLKESPQSYFKKKMSSRWMENPRVLFDCCVDLKIPKRVLDARREANAQKLSVTPHTNDAKKTNEVRAPHPANSTSAPAPAAQPVVATVIDDQSTSAPVTSQNSTETTPSIDSQKSVPAEHEVNSTSLEAASVGDTTSSNISTDNSLTSTKESISSGSNQQIRNESSTQRDMLSTPLEGETTATDLQSGAHIDTSVDHGSISASSQPVAESVTSHDVETAGVDTADVDAVEATNVSLSSSELTSGETGSVSDATFDSSDAGSIEAVEMDTPSPDGLSVAGEDSLEAGDQPGAVDVSPAEQAESVGDAVDADGGSDRETAAPSAEEDDSPSALDVVAYEAVESGEISLDSVPSDDDVGAEDVASEEDNGELGPDFLSGDESAAVDQVAVAESVDGAQDALSDAEMDDGDDVGVESEAGVDGELGTESDASDVPSSDLSLESSEESAEVDDGSLDIDEQMAVEDVAALDDATDLQGEFLAADDTDVYDVDESPLAGTDTPADEDVLSNGTADAGDELDFVSEAEVAELEVSLSDSNAALDDDFISEDEHADMATQDSPSAIDDTTDLQDDFLDTDDTDIDNTDDDFFSMDDLAVDEEDLPDSAVDAGDELGFDEQADVGLDADSDGLDIDTDATDIDADDDIDTDDDDDVSESGDFSL